MCEHCVWVTRASLTSFRGGSSLARFWLTQLHISSSSVALRTKIALLSVRPLSFIVRELVERAMQVDIQTHPKCMANWQPAILAPDTQDKHGHNSLLSNDGTEQSRASNTLPFLQTPLERRSHWAVSSPNLGSYSEQPYSVSKMWRVADGRPGTNHLWRTVSFPRTTRRHRTACRREERSSGSH